MGKNSIQSKLWTLLDISGKMITILGITGVITLILGVIDLFISDAAFWRGEPTSVLHTIYVWAFSIVVDGLYLAMFLGGFEADKKYDILCYGEGFGFKIFPIITLLTVESIFAIIGLLVWNCWKVPLKQAFSAAGPKMLQILIFCVVTFVLSFLIPYLIEKKYKAKKVELKKRERESHTICDPVMRDAVDEGRLVDVKMVQQYCKDNSVSDKTGIFIDKEFFFEEGLAALAKDNQITAKSIHQKSGIVKIYGTKNTARRAEVTEEIEID